MARWIIDPDHTVAAFAVRHFMVADVRGQFNSVSGTIDFAPPDLTSLRVEVSINASVITTGVARRDEHLKSQDFLYIDSVGKPPINTNLYSYTGNSPVNYTDPLGLWAIKLSFYWGQGGSLIFGSEDGRKFIRVKYGFGAGGGIRFYPSGGFPSDDKCTSGFIGASAQIGAALGPISGEIYGEAGGVITKRPDGRPHIRYHEHGGAKGSLKGETGWGLSIAGSANVVDVGIAW